MRLITVPALETVGVRSSYDQGGPFNPRDQQTFFLKLNRILIFKGPLTHTTQENVTTVYGIVSGPGTEDWCFGTTVFTKIAYPPILNWIKKLMGKKVF